MFTIANYYSKAGEIDFSSAPEALKKGHELIDKATGHGKDWSTYHESENVKRVIDTYFEKLAAFVKAKNSPTSTATKSTTNKKPVKKHPQVGPAEKTSFSLVERISEEIKFIRRYVKLHEKTKTKEEILRFINSLQKSILERRIRKTSEYAEQIRYIQGKLIEVYNSMKDKITLILKPEILDKLGKIASEEKVLLSVGFIKRYIALNGREGIKGKAQKLLTQINRAYEKKQVRDSDPYITELHDIRKNLEHLVAQRSKVLEIEKNTLSGLEGIVNGCTCQQLNGIDEKPVIMNSMDFANLEFKTLGFTGKWLSLIGDPSANFTMMVYGLPKMGKSYLCVDFAGYLARNHGKVLYVAKEEGLDKTLQDKLNDKDVMHPNLDVASVLPEDLSAYDFVFLDSVNSLGLKPEELRQLKGAYPGKAFVFVFQTTKDGKFRGANTFQHDVDSIIEVHEKGKARQNGRFNAGGDLSVF